MANAIEVGRLVKRYGSLTAVDGIDFKVRQGEVFAFLGPNGAGKTTTVEILEGLRNRTEGEVRVLGHDPWTDGVKLHREIGVIPQDFRFFDKIHPREAVEYYASLFGIRVRAQEILERVGLNDKSRSRFETLSGGQKQKLGLALALVNDPALLFLDEPTTGLDPQARRGIQEVIRELKRAGRTVFLTTHYLEEAEQLADRVAIIHHGAIIAAGTPDDIIARHGGPERLVIYGPEALAKYLAQTHHVPARWVDGHVEVEFTDKQDVLRLLSLVEASGIPWKGCTTAQDHLEDVFVRLVGRMDEGEIRNGASA
jgi:ABC-2 type transport system ATP-binding protein